MFKCRYSKMCRYSLSLVEWHFGCVEFVSSESDFDVRSTHVKHGNKFDLDSDDEGRKTFTARLAWDRKSFLIDDQRKFLRISFVEFLQI